MKAGADARALNLIKLYDEGLAAAKTDNRIDYATTRRRAKAFHDHPLGADGIVYPSRYAGSKRSVVLFDRCAAAIEVAAVTPLTAHPEFGQILDTYELGIARHL